jgi:salicylate hydroxylase
VKTEPRSRQILIAGAGIAGLTAAIAFAARGFSVQVFEKAPRIEEVGAGLQLSPNATRILDRLGVLELVMPAAARPEAVCLVEARGLREIARVPLGDFAEKRWRAPYLTVHRADLQSALLARAARDPDISIITGAQVRDAAFHTGGVTLSVDHEGRIREPRGLLAVGADGVWSSLRELGMDAMRHSFTGLTAWRATLRRGGGGFADQFLRTDVVTAYMHPRFHLVSYPLRGGSAVNLVAVTRGAALAQSWAASEDPAPLREAMAKAAPPLAGLVGNGLSWLGWPLHVVDPKGPWIGEDGIVLIGDAAHAMTPFAAQGAAMAIEDAYVLAQLVARHADDIATALRTYEMERRARVLKVVRRGALNRTAWHARGPVAFVRNVMLAARTPLRLAADLDWLYGWEWNDEVDED